MAWMLSPVGIGVIAVLIVVIASLIYWKLKPIKKWFATGAHIAGVAGRDIRRGSTAAESRGGRTPGVDFGEKGKFPGVQIEDITGCDLAED